MAIEEHPAAAVRDLPSASFPATPAGRRSWPLTRCHRRRHAGVQALAFAAGAGVAGVTGAVAQPACTTSAGGRQ